MAFGKFSMPLSNRKNTRRPIMSTKLNANLNAVELTQVELDSVAVGNIASAVGNIALAQAQQATLQALQQAAQQEKHQAAAHQASAQAAHHAALVGQN
jgi:hypothetical protein